jgi:hypothetical protein
MHILLHELRLFFSFSKIHHYPYQYYLGCINCCYYDGFVRTKLVHDLKCRNPTLAKCGGEAQHLEKLEARSLPGLPNVQSSIARGKTPRIGVFLVSLERS